MNELYDIPECKSPRLRWIEDNGILTAKDTTGTWRAVIPKDGDEWLGAAGLVLKYHGTLAASLVASGATEDDAITNLAKAIGLRLWNEAYLPEYSIPDEPRDLEGDYWRDELRDRRWEEKQE